MRHRKHMNVEGDISPGIDKLLDLFEVYYLSEDHSDFDNAIPINVVEKKRRDEESTLHLFPAEEPNLIWYADSLRRLFTQGVITPVLAMDTVEYGPCARLGVTHSTLKRMYWGLSKLARDQDINLYFHPRR